MSKNFIKVFRNIILFSIVFSNIVFFCFTFDQASVSRTDYVNFLTAAEIIKSGEGNKLYDISLQHRVQQELIGQHYKTEGTLLFMNIPFVAILYFPASLFSFIWGYRFMAAVILVLFMLIIWWLNKVAKSKVVAPQNLLLIGLLFYPFGFNMINVQLVPILVLGILVGVYYSLVREKYFLLGLFLGLLIIKFQYLTIAPFILLLSKEKIKTIKGFCLSSVVIISISALLISWGSLTKYPSFLIATDIPQFAVDSWKIFSIHSLFKVLPFLRNLSPGYVLGLDFIAYVAVLIIYWLRYKKVLVVRSFQAAVILAVPLSIHVFPQDTILLLMPLFLFYTEYLLNKKNHYLLFVMVALYLLPLLDLLDLNILGAFVFLATGIVTLFLTGANKKELTLATD